MKDHQVQNERGSAPTPDLFSHICGITGDDISQHTETCEVILYYPKIGGNDIEDYAKKAIRNILHANIDVHSRRLVAEFPIYGIKCIERLQLHCANMTFSDKSIYDRTFQQVTNKGGKYAMNYIKIFQNTHALSISVGNFYSEDQLMHTFHFNHSDMGMVKVWEWLK